MKISIAAAPVPLRDGYVTSLDLARWMQLPHARVLRRVRSVRCDDGFRREHLLEVIGQRAGGRPHIRYHLTRRGATLVVMSFSGIQQDRFKIAWLAGLEQLLDVYVPVAKKAPVNAATEDSLRQMLAAGCTQKEAARRLSISQATVSLILSGKYAALARTQRGTAGALSGVRASDAV